MSNIFSLFGGKSSDLPPSDGKVPYKAYTVVDDEWRRGSLGIVLGYPDGVDEVLYYTNLIRVLAIDHDYLILFSSDYTYTMIGKSLSPLIPLLRDHQITTLEAYKANKHAPLPSDYSDMVIERIQSWTNAEWQDIQNNREAENKPEAQPPTVT